MLYRWFLILELMACACVLTITKIVVSAGAGGSQRHALEEIITLAIEHNPAMAGALRVVKQSGGR